ncbi:MAG TPA: alpha/beta family hydrolase [Chthoniobacterales bacterium]|jgi:hypothetical protein
MAKPLFLFAPGAGAPSTHPWMQAWKARLREIGDVEMFDYDYMREGRKRPDRLPQLIAAHRAALAAVRAKTGSERRTILIGKSMGGRIGCHLALKLEGRAPARPEGEGEGAATSAASQSSALQITVDGLVCLGYPLCAMGDRSKLRDQVLRSLGTPILFVQGTRDRLCPLDLLEAVRREMTAPNDLQIVESGDHSLLVGKRPLQTAGETQEEVDRRILDRISRFMNSLPDRR